MTDSASCQQQYRTNRHTISSYPSRTSSLEQPAPAQSSWDITGYPSQLDLESTLPTNFQSSLPRTRSKSDVRPYHLVRSNSTSSTSSRSSSPSRPRRHRSAKRVPSNPYTDTTMTRQSSHQSRSLPISSPLSTPIDPDAYTFTPSPPPTSKWSERRRSVHLFVDTAGAVKVMQEKKAAREAAKVQQQEAVKVRQQQQQQQQGFVQRQEVVYQQQQQQQQLYAQPRGSYGRGGMNQRQEVYIPEAGGMYQRQQAVQYQPGR
ncbi:hypothetical protein HDV00_010101, partial [Rhizophlyctis rosea]